MDKVGSNSFYIRNVDGKAKLFSGNNKSGTDLEVSSDGILKIPTVNKDGGLRLGIMIDSLPQNVKQVSIDGTKAKDAITVRAREGVKADILVADNQWKTKGGEKPAADNSISVFHEGKGDVKVLTGSGDGDRAVASAKSGNAEVIDSGGNSNQVKSIAANGYARAITGTGDNDFASAIGTEDVFASDLGGNSRVKTPEEELVLKPEDLQRSLGKEPPPPTVASE